MTNWTYKVVKVQRGGDGKWFDYPTAATFCNEGNAIKYAEQFADEQRQVAGTKIVVRTRKGNRTIKSITTLATV